MASEQAFRAFRLVSQHPGSHNPKVAGSYPAPATESPGQRTAGQGFYRVMRFFYRRSGWLLFDELLEGAGGFGLHPGEHMLVGVDGEGGVRVTQPLRHDFDGYSGFDEQGAVGVPQIVEADPWYSCPGGDAFEGLGDRMRVDGPAVGVGEHPTL